jgi:allantoin racemase
LKILIINPNSDPVMTARIQKTAEQFAGSEFEVEARPTPGAPVFLETYEDASLSAPGMIRLLRDNEEAFDAFIVACHCDPNLDALKEITDKPVVGISEASMAVASLLGHRFSVISDNSHSIPNKEALARKYHRDGLLASVRAPEKERLDRPDLEKYTSVGRDALEKDGAEVLILGCAAMTGLDRPLQERLGAPVVDGIKAALMIARGLVRAGLSTSKIRRYNPNA